jgi:hypothetical protein
MAVVLWEVESRHDCVCRRGGVLRDEEQREGGGPVGDYFDLLLVRSSLEVSVGAQSNGVGENWLEELGGKGGEVGIRVGGGHFERLRDTWSRKSVPLLGSGEQVDWKVVWDDVFVQG